MRNAQKMLEEFGSQLVGRIVFTMPYGGYAGGLAEVTEIMPDPMAPEIPFQVKSMRTQEEIGVFGDELLLFREDIEEVLQL